MKKIDKNGDNRNVNYSIETTQSQYRSRITRQSPEKGSRNVNMNQTPGSKRSSRQSSRQQDSKSLSGWSQSTGQTNSDALKRTATKSRSRVSSRRSSVGQNKDSTTRMTEDLGTAQRALERQVRGRSSEHGSERRVSRKMKTSPSAGSKIRSNQRVGSGDALRQFSPLRLLLSSSYQPPKVKYNVLSPRLIRMPGASSELASFRRTFDSMNVATADANAQADLCPICSISCTSVHHSASLPAQCSSSQLNKPSAFPSKSDTFVNESLLSTLLLSGSPLSESVVGTGNAVGEFTTKSDSCNIKSTWMNCSSRNTTDASQCTPRWIPADQQNSGQWASSEVPSFQLRVCQAKQLPQQVSLAKQHCNHVAHPLDQSPYPEIDPLTKQPLVYIFGQEQMYPQRSDLRNQNEHRTMSPTDHQHLAGTSNQKYPMSELLIHQQTAERQCTQQSYPPEEPNNYHETSASELHTLPRRSREQYVNSNSPGLLMSRPYLNQQDIPEGERGTPPIVLTKEDQLHECLLAAKHQYSQEMLCSAEPGRYAYFKKEDCANIRPSAGQYEFKNVSSVRQDCPARPPDMESKYHYAAVSGRFYQDGQRGEPIHQLTYQMPTQSMPPQVQHLTALQLGIDQKIPTSKRSVNQHPSLVSTSQKSGTQNSSVTWSQKSSIRNPPIVPLAQKAATWNSVVNPYTQNSTHPNDLFTWQGGTHQSLPHQQIPKSEQLLRGSADSLRKQARPLFLETSVDTGMQTLLRMPHPLNSPDVIHENSSNLASWRRFGQSFLDTLKKITRILTFGSYPRQCSPKRASRGSPVDSPFMMTITKTKLRSRKGRPSCRNYRCSVRAKDSLQNSKVSKPLKANSVIHDSFAQMFVSTMKHGNVYVQEKNEPSFGSMDKGITTLPKPTTNANKGLTAVQAPKQEGGEFTKPTTSTQLDLNSSKATSYVVCPKSVIGDTQRPVNAITSVFANEKATGASPKACANHSKVTKKALAFPVSAMAGQKAWSKSFTDVLESKPGIAPPKSHFCGETVALGQKKLLERCGPRQQASAQEHRDSSAACPEQNCSVQKNRFNINPKKPEGDGPGGTSGFSKREAPRDQPMTEMCAKEKGHIITFSKKPSGDALANKSRYPEQGATRGPPVVYGQPLIFKKQINAGKETGPKQSASSTGISTGAKTPSKRLVRIVRKKPATKAPFRTCESAWK